MSESKQRKCRVCECTDDDCSQCIEAQGHPCAWVEDDLCSRCAGAGTSINIQRGCEHNCLYCYARHNAVHRYYQCRVEHWPLPCINEKKVDAPHKKKYDGVVMFPTTHDITEANLSQYCCVLRKLLDAGNKVLIVSKPHLACIKFICAGFKKHKENILFRFTIGSTENDKLKFWEPGAPSLTERLDCLKYACRKGFATSISCEPFLDPLVDYLYEICIEYVTESFWIGKLNRFDSRVNLAGVNKTDIERYVEPLKRAQSDAVVMGMYEMMKDRPLIQWKDSIRKVIDGKG